MLKNLLSWTCLLLLSVSCASAAEYDNFAVITAAGLKPFARDLGGLLGSGLNQTARPLGFSGFDVGVRGVAQLKPSRGNTALKKNSVFGLGFMQAEIGMPYRIDGFVRAASYEGLTVAGGGLRYGLWNVSDQKNHVNAMLVALADLAAHRCFYAVHYNATLVFSLNRPVFSPYIGAGMDSTRLEAQAVTVPALQGKSVTTVMPRYSAGLRARFNLIYLAAGATYTHGRTLYNASTGIRF